MNIYVTGTIWVLGAAVLTGVIAFLVRRQRVDEDRDQDTSMASTVFTLVGGLHAVLLVFVLIALFDATSTAEDDAVREADGLVAISWAGDSLPEPARTRIHELCQSYAATVVEQEWPRMREGEQVEGDGWAKLDDLRLAIEQVPPADDWQQDRKAEAANQLWEVYQARQDRLNAIGSGVSTVVWFALILGSLMSMALPYLFGATKLRAYVVTVSILGATIALLLFAIFQLQNPFSGGASVEPEAFEAALDRLG